jgi:peroxidase
VVVQGCDASVLLKPTDANPQPEMLGIPKSLRGCEVIDAAKAALEPGRRVVRRHRRVRRPRRQLLPRQLYGIDFKMPAGSSTRESVARQRDALRHASAVRHRAAAQADMFAAVDMVVLSHYSSFSDRLPPSKHLLHGPARAFATQLKDACASLTGADNTAVVQLDYKTSNELDNWYCLKRAQRSLLASDAALLGRTTRCGWRMPPRPRQYKFGEDMHGEDGRRRGQDRRERQKA